MNQEETITSSEAQWTIETSGLADFKVKLWLKVQPHLHREVIFINKAPTWSEKERPEEVDLHKFLIFFYKVGRRTVNLNGVTDADISRWSTPDDRLIVLNICAYSMNVASKPNWTQVAKLLIKPAEKDKSGAAAGSAINELVDELKASHQFHYTAPYICWRQWADYVLNKPGNMRAQLIQDHASHHLIHLFTRSRNNNDVLLNNIRQNVNIGDGINNDVWNELERIQGDVDGLKLLIDESLNVVDLIENRINAMRIKCQHTTEHLNLFQDAMGPEENCYGRALFENIREQEDDDHADYLLDEVQNEDQNEKMLILLIYSKYKR